MGTPFHSMTIEQKNSFNERYLAVYAQYLDAEEPAEAERLKGEMTQMELEAGLYGSL